MEVNSEKSATMVFRQGGKLSRREKWQFKGVNITIKNEYSYLGVILTPKISLQKHFIKRNTSAKISINSTWTSFFSKKDINLRSKWQMFQAVCRATQSYAAQVWGDTLFEDVDKLQLYFVKKILRLPECSPTYAIMLETNMESGHIYTLALHLNYIQRTIFEYSNKRLPHNLTLKVLRKNIFWAESLNKIGREFNLRWDDRVLNANVWKGKKETLIMMRNNKIRDSMWERSQKSAERIYKHLDCSIGKTYFNDKVGRYKISLIFKARCNLLKLNGIYNNNCTLCNLNEKEDVEHFIGRCPILSQFRVANFQKTALTHYDIVNVLNGKNDESWNKLVSYITGALKYRELILNEFA